MKYECSDNYFLKTKICVFATLKYGNKISCMKKNALKLLILTGKQEHEIITCITFVPCLCNHFVNLEQVFNSYRAL